MLSQPEKNLIINNVTNFDDGTLIKVSDNKLEDWLVPMTAFSATDYEMCIKRPLKDRFLEIFFSNLKNFDILAQKIARKIIGPYAFKASSVKNIVNFSFLLHQSAAIPYFKQQELLSALN